MKQILLVCNAGMSTSMLVKKMQQSATERGIEVSIEAKSITEAKKNIHETDEFHFFCHTILLSTLMLGLIL